MHTPTHALFNVALLDRRGERRDAMAIFVGAVLPDVPSMFFYFLYGIVLRLPDSTIWGLYQQPLWRLSTTALHAIPVVLLVLAVAAWRRSRALALLGASLLLHIALDAPLHSRDGHAHLWPLTDWTLVSPLSYWDRAHHAMYWVPVEMLMLVGGSWLVWRKHRSRWLAAALAMMDIAMIAAWLSGTLFWGS